MQFSNKVQSKVSRLACPASPVTRRPTDTPPAASASPALMPQPFLAPILPAPTPLDTATLINMNLAAAAQLQQEAAAPELLFRSQQPNNTVMIRGLAQHVTENDVSEIVHDGGGGQGLRPMASRCDGQRMVYRRQ